MRIRRLLLAASLILAALPLPWARSATPSPQTTSWTTALQAIPDGSDLPALYRPPEVAGRSVRQLVYPSLGGSSVRLHISNRYGRTPLQIERAGLARSAGGAATVAGSWAAATFGGKPSLRLAPGAEADSDPLPLRLLPREPYAVSVYLGPQQRLQAWHRIASQVNYVSAPGDHAADAAGSAYRGHFTQFAWLTRLSVAEPAGAAVMAIGDSITDGLRSTLGRNQRWPDALGRRLAAAGSSLGVLNAGISGNRLLSDSPCYGERLLARFEHDALLPGVRTVIVQIGINDINFPAMPARHGLDCDYPHTPVSAEQLAAGYRQLIAAAHRHGIRVLGGTLTPASLPPAREAIRAAANRWIRDSGAFDGVIDFDAALRDPARPQQLRAVYDSGDHVHPSDAGYAAMAAAIPLPLLGGGRAR